MGLLFHHITITITIIITPTAITIMKIIVLDIISLSRNDRKESKCTYYLLIEYCNP